MAERRDLHAVALVLLLSTGAPGAWAIDDAPAAEPAGERARALLEEIWLFARDHVYPVDLRERFDGESRERIEAAISGGAPLAEALNPFLESLGVSHTRFYDKRHHGYYMLRSLFTTSDPDTPALYTLGVQLHEGGEPGRIRAVLDGSPAAQAGLAVGERILAVNGQPFRSLLDWQMPEPVTLTVDAPGASARQLSVQPVRSGYHRAFVDATARSARALACAEGGAVGYLHLWAGTDPAFLALLEQAAARSRSAGHRGFVLDLRDGYGGAWWPYLDPFFADRSSYFVAERLEGDGVHSPFAVEAGANPEHFGGPLAVLVNGGTRSGKESLAFQFRKTGRGRLFGTTTAGAFTAGMGVFSERESADYLLFLSVAEMRLDGTQIEGVGVAPDEAVPFAAGRDAPLEAALRYLRCEPVSAS